MHLQAQADVMRGSDTFGMMIKNDDDDDDDDDNTIDTQQQHTKMLINLLMVNE